MACCLGSAMRGFQQAAALQAWAWRCDVCELALRPMLAGSAGASQLSRTMPPGQHMYAQQQLHMHTSHASLSRSVGRRVAGLAFCRCALCSGSQQAALPEASARNVKAGSWLCSPCGRHAGGSCRHVSARTHRFCQCVYVQHPVHQRLAACALLAKAQAIEVQTHLTEAQPKHWDPSKLPCWDAVLSLRVHEVALQLCSICWLMHGSCAAD